MDFSTKQKLKPDSILIEKLINRDGEALSSIVSLYTEQLLRGAYGLGFKDEEANDIVQEVWLTFVEIIARFENRSSIKTFLFGILYNKAREKRRELKRFASDEDFDVIMDENFNAEGFWTNPPIDPESFYSAAQKMASIKDCIDTLPIQQRMAFCLKEIDEHKTSDICKILEISSTNLGVLLHRAKGKLRSCIEKKAT